MIDDALRTDLGELLSAHDPAPVEQINSASTHPVLLVCEHAGKRIPEKLFDLGVHHDELERHIGWDIGAAAVTRLLAAMLGAPAVLQTYSRLVIDCNRPPHAPDAMPQISDATPVPGNQGLSKSERVARVAEIFDPYQTAVTKARLHPSRRMIISVHSFTAKLADELRPWDVAFLYRGDTDTPSKLRQSLLTQEPGLKVGMNEPYQIEDASDWFVPQHGEASGLPHSLIEIRNDLISDHDGQTHWASLMKNAIESVIEGK